MSNQTQHGLNSTPRLLVTRPLCVCSCQCGWEELTPSRQTNAAWMQFIHLMAVHNERARPSSVTRPNVRGEYKPCNLRPHFVRNSSVCLRMLAFIDSFARIFVGFVSQGQQDNQFSLEYPSPPLLRSWRRFTVLF